MKNFILFLIVVAVAAGVIFFIRQNQEPKQQDNVQVSPWPAINPVNPNVPVVPTPDKMNPVDPNVIEPLKPVFRIAQAENKKVLLFVTMDRCVWCDKMKRDVIPKVNLSTFAYLETKNTSVIRQYNVDSFPTFILLDKNGTELKRTAGYSTIETFQYWLSN